MKKMILTLFLALSASTLAVALPLGTIYAAAYDDYDDDDEDDEDYEDDEGDEGPDIMYYIDDTGDEPDDEEDDTDEDDGGIYIYVDTSDVDNAATPDEEHWSGDTATSSAASTSSVSASSASSSRQASSTPVEEAYSARSEAVRIPAGLLKAAGIPKARITQAENELRRILKVTNFENIKLKRQSAERGVLTIQIKYQTKVFYQEISPQAVTYRYRGKSLKLKELMPILINSYRSPKGEAFGY